YSALDVLLASNESTATITTSLLAESAGGMGPVGSGMSGGPYGGLGGGFGSMSGGSGAGETVTQYAIGPRGTEKITTRDAQTGNTIKVLYAMYDAHGNMMCTARRDGSQLLIENNRGFDAWGAIRWGDGSTGGSGHGVDGGGDPFDASVTDGSQRYVANLGHMADDESGLIYMRARYYEPSTGRFISEDPARDGKNWFVYCKNNPISEVDPSGTVSKKDWDLIMSALLNTSPVGLFIVSSSFLVLSVPVVYAASHGCIQASIFAGIILALSAFTLYLGLVNAQVDTRMERFQYYFIGALRIISSMIGFVYKAGRSKFGKLAAGFTVLEIIRQTIYLGFLLFAMDPH
ncbi:MAG: RHS repeat-associated core domain-containing protein, partial [Fimbriimonadaceae bacterium]